MATTCRAFFFWIVAVPTCCMSPLSHAHARPPKIIKIMRVLMTDAWQMLMKDAHDRCMRCLGQVRTATIWEQNCLVHMTKRI